MSDKTRKWVTKRVYELHHPYQLYMCNIICCFCNQIVIVCNILCCFCNQIVIVCNILCCFCNQIVIVCNQIVIVCNQIVIVCNQIVIVCNILCCFCNQIVIVCNQIVIVCNQIVIVCNILCCFCNQIVIVCNVICYKCYIICYGNQEMSDKTGKWVTKRGNEWHQSNLCISPTFVSVQPLYQSNLWIHITINKNKYSNIHIFILVYTWKKELTFLFNLLVTSYKL
jgi:hypothetical protein